MLAATSQSGFYRMSKQTIAALFAVICGVGQLASAQTAQSAAELAKQLSNPVASLISVPFQLNYDEGFGADGNGKRTLFNIQPVVPFDLNADWNLISRTIVPLIENDGIVPDERKFGLGNVIQSFFFSPKQPTSGGWILGAGPAIQIPLSTDDRFGADDWAVGPTAVALKQAGPWTFGALGNHLWDVGGSDADINATFLQPFLSYTTPEAVSYTINSESTYDWENEEWSVPINFQITKLVTIGNQPISIGGGIRYWADAPSGAADDFGARLIVVYLFPK